MFVLVAVIGAVRLELPVFVVFMRQAPMTASKRQAAPYEGWSIKNLPVRSTVVVLPPLLARDHAFDPTAIAGVLAADDAAETGFLAGGSPASLAAALRTRSVGVIRRASGDLMNS